MAKNSELFLCMLIIAAFGLVCYFNSFYNDFVWDDRHLILGNSFLRQPDIFRIFSQDLANTGFSKTYFYRPLQNLSYVIDYKIWRFNPLGYHLTNTLIHILNAALVFLLIKALARRKILALLTALFFVSHPIHYGVVTYLSGRADSLFTAFFLISFLAFIKYRESFNGRFLLISAAGLILSLFSKEMAVFGIFIFILYDVIFRKKNMTVRKMALAYIALGIPLLVYGIFRFNHARELISDSFQGGNIYEHAVTFPKIIAEYLVSLIAPINLHMVKDLELAKTIFEPQIMASLILVALIITLGFKVKNRNKEVSFFIFYFFITLLPVSSILIKRNVLLADNWLYMPAIAYCFIISYCLVSIRPRTGFILGIFLVGIYSSMAIKQNRYWRDDITLFNKILEYNPCDPVVRGNLGLVYLYNGEYEKALEEGKKAIAISPEYPTGYHASGVICFDTGNLEKAKEFFKKAVEKDDSFDIPHLYLGIIYLNRGKLLEAEEEFKRCIELAPHAAGGYVNMGILKYRQDKPDEASALFSIAIEKNPGSTRAYLYLSTILRKNKKFVESLKLLERARVMDPGNVDILLDLGNTYNSFGQFDRAIGCFRKAINISPDRSELYYNMGTSYRLKKNREPADRYWRRALEINPAFKEARDSLKKLKSSQ